MLSGVGAHADAANIAAMPPIADFIVAPPLGLSIALNSQPVKMGVDVACKMFLTVRQLRLPRSGHGGEQ